jgi:hypothetical protein
VSTQRATLRAAILAALNGAGKPAGLTVLAARAAPSEHDTLPLTMVKLSAETVVKVGQHKTAPIVQRHLTVWLDHWVKGTDPQDGLEAQLAWATSAMLQTQTWGGLAIETTEEGTEWDLEVLEDEFGRATQRFTVRFPTPTASQEA